MEAASCSSSTISCPVAVWRPAHIYSPENSLPWPVRYNIVIGLSATLMYLQHEAEQRVLHRDIKPSNVMLDASYNAQLGNFGLARLIDESRQSYTTGVTSTLGYMDTQCFLAGRASINSDIYSFGVFLLEVVCCWRPAVLQDGGEYAINLVQRVCDMHGGSAGMHNAADTDKDDNTLKLNSMSCTTTYNYTGTGYMKNLNKLLSALSFNAIIGDGFNTIVVSKGTTDQVFGLIMCYADTNMTEFHKCLIGAANRIMQLWPGCRTVNINSKAYILHYSNSLPDTSFVESYIKNMTHMGIARLKLLSWLAKSSSDKPLRLDYGNVTYMDPWLGTSVMYGLPQCMRDLAPSECNRCQHGYVGLIRKFYHKKTDSSVKGYKCYLRFQLSPFDIMLPITSPPPPPRASKRFIVVLTIGG
uniref:Protein kinase domain-containing protein n=1 Tax=Leersia perrieri TaxID=77586 RepID=A0A0D9XCA3_9ORYZ